jgi:hypothetical protein
MICEMSLPTGRGLAASQQLGPCQKAGEHRELLGTCGDSGEVASTIGVLLSKDSIECGNTIVNEGEPIAEENDCQYNNLRDQLREE